MLNQRLQQKLQQKLSPQQIQLMKLLQIPTATLEQRIEEELEANPALEEGATGENEDDLFESSNEEDSEDNSTDDEFDLSDYLQDDDTPDYKLKDPNNYYDPDEEDAHIPIAVKVTFHEHLLNQLGMQDLNDHQKIVGQHLVGSIDEDGYIRRELDAVVDDLAFSQNVSTDEEELQLLLEVIQQFDPPGVGARNLQECLYLQLIKRQGESEAIDLATAVVENHFETFAKKHYEKLQKSLKITSDELKEALEEILKLNPKPGSNFATSSKVHNYIIPDFLLENRDGTLNLRLNGRNAPELRVSGSFKEMLKSYKESKEKSKEQKDAVLFIKQKIDAAKWFIDAIRQRQNTMILVMRAIMEIQNDFLVSGDELQLKPMILKDIADKTDLDISTVSRVANSKYVQTEFGTMLLKSFFSESLSTDTGEEVSTREVKKILTDLIENEDKKKPLSDQRLMELLKEKGYQIARRTVAKYREQLNLPVARLRKEL